MNKFQFDYSINKVLNEKLFSDDETEDLIDNDLNISLNFDFDNDILKRFNELYADQKKMFKKYGIKDVPKFTKIEHQTINGKDYKLLTQITKTDNMFIHPIKLATQGFTYILSTQDLIDFIEENNIIIQCPLKIYDNSYIDTFSFNTYIIHGVNLYKDFINNFSLLALKFGINYRLGPKIILTNSNIFDNEIMNMLSINNTDILILNDLTIDNCNIKNISVTISKVFNLTIQNCNQLTDINLTYNCDWGNDAKLYIKKCNNLKHVNIADISKLLALTKMQITDCPAINKLTLPNHHTKSYINQLNSSTSLLRKICFRGDIVKRFYLGVGKLYQYPYWSVYNVSPYWKKEG